MARLIGPDANSRLVYALVGGTFASAIGKTATVYSDAAGTTLADIAAYQPGNPTVPGSVIAGSTLTVDSTSQLPLFWFPASGADSLYVQVAGGPVMKINADYDARLDAFTGTNYRGAWAPSTAYAVNDLASIGGELVLCAIAHTSGASFSLTNWSNLTGKSGVYNVKLYGAKGDGKFVADAATTSGQATLTSATAAFTAADAGKAITINGGAGGSNTLSTTILTVNSATSVTLAANASTTLSGAYIVWGSDDTAAINAAVTAAKTGAVANAAEVAFPPGIYVTAGATTMGGATQGNAQIPLPVVVSTGEKLVLKFRGIGDGTAFGHWQQTVGQMSGAVIFSTLVNQTPDGTWGPQSVIGGPTVTVNGSGTYTNVKFIAENITVVMPYNPSYLGFDLRYVAQASLISASVLANAGPAGSPALTTLPTNSNGLAIRMPSNGNNDCATAFDVAVAGVYYAISIGEHFVSTRFVHLYCQVGIFIGGIGGTGYHGASIANLSSEASGINIQCFGGTPGGSYPMFIGMMNTETTVTRDIDDANNNLTGVVYWSSPVEANTPVVSGGANFKVINTNLSGKPGAATSPGVPSSTTPLTNPFWRDAMVVVTGGTSVSAVSVDGVAQGYSATPFTVVVPSGKTITLTYAAAPSWKWTLL